MKGVDIKGFREKLRLSPREFATLVGASTSTVYRWEWYGLDTVPLDPFPALVMTWLSKRCQEPHQDWIEEVREACVMHGPLAGLATLLKPLVPPPQGRSAT